MTMLWYDRDGEAHDWDAERYANLVSDRDYSTVLSDTLFCTEHGDLAVISTVWLGIDVGFSEPPLIFETVAFYSDSEENTEPTVEVMGRWPTESQARKGHAEAILEMTSGECKK